MKSICVIWALCASLISCVDAKAKMTRVVQVKEYVGCDMKLPFHQEGITVNVTGKGMITLNGHLDIDEDVGNLTQVTIHVDKCQSYSDLGSCEFYIRMVYDTPCQMVVQRGAAWTPIFDKITPRLSCPFRKGVYVLQGSTMDASLAAQLMPPNIFWRATLRLFVGKRIVSCFKVGVELVEMRDRSKSTG